MKIRIKYKLLAPLSHIGETASTGSYFQTVLTSVGKVPVITGNSIRGQIRDSIALDLLCRLNCQVDKEAFNVLFSGGADYRLVRGEAGRKLRYLAGN